MQRRIPLVTCSGADEAERVFGALARAGFSRVEVALRTPYAMQAIALCAQAFPALEVGAGTVLNEKSCEEALAAGARFIVSPGLSREVACCCKQRGVPYYPGCVTPTEIMQALELGITTVKFFPASLHGGLAGMKALSAPFPALRFFPTGGITRANEQEYLAFEKTAFVGGSYLVEEALSQ